MINKIRSCCLFESAVFVLTRSSFTHKSYDQHVDDSRRIIVIHVSVVHVHEICLSIKHTYCYVTWREWCLLLEQCQSLMSVPARSSLCWRHHVMISPNACRYMYRYTLACVCRAVATIYDVWDFDFLMSSNTALYVSNSRKRYWFVIRTFDSA